MGFSMAKWLFFFLFSLSFQQTLLASDEAVEAKNSGPGEQEEVHDIEAPPSGRPSHRVVPPPSRPFLPTDREEFRDMGFRMASGFFMHLASWGFVILVGLGLPSMNLILKSFWALVAGELSSHPVKCCLCWNKGDRPGECRRQCCRGGLQVAYFSFIATVVFVTYALIVLDPCYMENYGPDYFSQNLSSSYDPTELLFDPENTGIAIEHEDNGTTVTSETFHVLGDPCQEAYIFPSMTVNVGVSWLSAFSSALTFLGVKNFCSHRLCFRSRQS